jgi:hypothetical protein
MVQTHCTSSPSAGCQQQQSWTLIALAVSAQSLQDQALKKADSKRQEVMLERLHHGNSLQVA